MTLPSPLDLTLSRMLGDDPGEGVVVHKLWERLGVVVGKEEGSPWCVVFVF